MTPQATVRALSVGMLVESRDRGFGRVRAWSGKRAQVAYFDVPGPDGTVVVEENIGDLRRGVLPPQTRVHWRVRRDGSTAECSTTTPTWAAPSSAQRASSGSLPTQRSLSGGVSQSLTQADYLPTAGSKSRRYHDGRHAFVEAYAARATAYQGMTAISSSSVEAHPHQIEAVRRVLSDAIPRYLLADEVGLGKTIEAGFLVRQHLLDSSRHRALVLVPPALERQWEEEMESKFRLVSEFESAFELWSFDDLAEARSPSGFSLVVVDEAHRVTERGADAPEYRALCALADGAQALLLLSATPLLQEPASLQRLLSLLAPGARRVQRPGGLRPVAGLAR